MAPYSGADWTRCYIRVAMAKTASADVQTRRDALAPTPPRRVAWAVDLYRSAIGKKYVMAVTGIVLMGYVLAHMLGNLKIYLGPTALNDYAEFLRDLGEPVAPRSVVLWILRSGLVVAFALHIHAAYALTVMNRRARPVAYQSRREYVAANFAARTMRWTGVIVGLFVLFHLADLTWGFANPAYVRGDVYHNVVASFQRWPVALLYVLANLALGLHLYHGAWSVFQSLGVANPRFNHWRRYFAVAFALVVTLGNVTFPTLVLAGVVS
ncbi:MAG: succinate dehydrogenase cytochrome b subunit [Egibacteraceae bacterium]